MTDRVEDWELRALEEQIRDRTGFGGVRVEQVQISGGEFFDVEFEDTIVDFPNISAIYSWLDESTK